MCLLQQKAALQVQFTSTQVLNILIFPPKSNTSHVIMWSFGMHILLEKMLISFYILDPQGHPTHRRPEFIMLKEIF